MTRESERKQNSTPVVGTWRVASSDSRTRGLGTFCINRLSWISPMKSAEKIKARIQIYPNVNFAIIRKGYGSWEKCSHQQFPKTLETAFIFFPVGEQLLVVENLIIFN